MILRQRAGAVHGSSGNCRADMPGLVVHGSAVSVEGRGCLITGASGSGKSTLALEMIAAGAVLVADDQTRINESPDGLMMTAPPSIAGRIEARGVGVLKLDTTTAPLTLMVDLDRASMARLPAPRYRHLLDVACPVILGKGRGGLAAIVRLLLLQGVEASG